MFYVNENLPRKSLPAKIENLTESFLKSVSVVPSGYLWVVTNAQIKRKNFLSVIYLRLWMHFHKNMTIFCGDIIISNWKYKIWRITKNF